MLRRSLSSFAGAVVLVALPAVSLAAEPPNQNDPCSRAGRNKCGTLGVGFYAQSRYGVRWYGDFRGAVPGEPHTFCLDLRFWYASPDYRYRAGRAGRLLNREGEAVSVEKQRKIAYAIWSYGRSTKPNQQAAVGLYVHSLMGDARPGEADPVVLNPKVARLYERIARDAARYHGPYRIAARLSKGLVVGKRARATIRVLSAEGNALPNVQLTFAARGATGLPQRARTNAKGIASVPLTATDAGTVRLSVEARRVASTLPKVFRATTAAAAPNSQRLAAPRSRRVSATASALVKRQLAASSVAVPARIAVGQTSRAQVSIDGALPSWHGTVAVRIHGPFPTPDAMRCDRAPVWKRSFTATGSGVFTPPAAKLEEIGWYGYEAVVPGDGRHVGVMTTCRASLRVEAQPRVRTKISSARVLPGTAIFDRIHVNGLAGQSATVKAALYGPFATREAIACNTKPVWTGSLAVPADGEHTTEPFTLTAPGFYTYKEWISGTGFVRATETPCGETAETTLVRAQPTVTTVASAEIVRAGSSIFDRIQVRGLGRVAAAIEVKLFGPFASRSAMRCDGRPYWTGRVTASGDGEIRSPRVKVAKAGFYTYREQLIDSPLVTETTTECALAAETALAAPKIVTGRGDAARYAPASEVGRSAPTRVRLASVGIDARISPVVIDLVNGVLGVPASIRRAGWWKDGMAPGAESGAILISGHVDSASNGAGAFFSLHRAKRGDRVVVGTASGRTFSYRVVSVRNFRKDALPTSVYSRKGAPRLVLVTCGGPFDPAVGRYRDNVVVTAVPTGA